MAGNNIVLDIFKKHCKSFKVLFKLDDGKKIKKNKKILVVEGNAFDVTVKPLSWSKKNQFLSKCLRWDSDGNTVFDGDAYVRLALQEIIIAAPWGKTSELFLISIDERLGSTLEKLVPQAFGSDMGGEVENLKDGS